MNGEVCKQMISFKSFLTEVRESFLYHSTPISSANQILNGDILYTSEQMEGITSNQEVIFFTRSLKHAQHIYNFYGESAILEFNRDKLSQRYKIEPIKNHPPMSKIHKPMYMSGRVGGNEFEEIVRKNITRVNDYISTIYLSKNSFKFRGIYPDLFDDTRVKFI